jgi:hypothetical protein
LHQGVKCSVPTHRRDRLKSIERDRAHLVKPIDMKAMVAALERPGA